MNISKTKFLLTLLFISISFKVFAYIYGYVGDQYYKCDLTNCKAWLLPPADGSVYSGDLTIKSEIWYQGNKPSPVLTVVGIGKSACKRATDLTSVKFSDYIETVDDSAFYYCTSLASVTLNDKLEKINDAVFFGCSALKAIEFPSTLKKIGKSAFYFTGLSGEVTIPSSVDSIGADAFNMSIGIKKLNLSSNNITIGNNAFYGFYADTVNVQSLENWVSYKFGNLDSNPIHYKKATLTLNGSEISDADLSSENIDTIGKASFYGNKTLETVTFGKNLKVIEEYAFYNTSKLSNLIFLSDTPPTLGSNAFGTMIRDQVTLYIPAGSREAYSKIFVFSYLKDVVEVEDKGTSTVLEDAICDKSHFNINNRIVVFDNATNVCIYDLSGNCIYMGNTSEYEFNNSGIYIVNGKKVLVR